MADRYRKDPNPRVPLNCTISPETDKFLKDFRGQFSYGWAIEELVRQYRSLAGKTTASAAGKPN